MPSRKPKRSNNRKKFYKKYKSYRSMAYNAYKGVRFLKGLVNVENHLFDALPINGAVTTTSNIACMSDIQTGDANYARTGTSILAKHMVVRGYITMSASATATLVRILIVKDLTNHNAAPSAGDILNDTSHPITSPLTEDNTDRFWVMYDKIYSLGSASRQVINFKKYIPINDHLKFVSGTGTGKYETNSIWILVVSNEATNSPAVQIENRLSFYDN